MTESEYIDLIHKLVIENDKVTSEAMELIDKAVEKYPQSERLWIKRGDMIQVGPLDTPYESKDALFCYQEALKINPCNIEAHEEIGHFYDTVMENEIEAKKWFEKAKELNKR